MTISFAALARPLRQTMSGAVERKKNALLAHLPRLAACSSTGCRDRMHASDLHRTSCGIGKATLLIHVMLERFVRHRRDINNKFTIY
jgi:hypothetical protein